MTCMRTWTSSNFGLIGPPTAGLAVLIYNVVNTLGPTFFYRIFFILAGYEHNQQVWTEFEFWPDWTKGCGVTALERCQKLVFAQYLEKDGQKLTKFCIHIIIDKIYISTLKRHFWQICNRVTSLDRCQKLVIAQYLENGWTEFDQILYTIYH